MSRSSNSRYIYGHGSSYVFFHYFFFFQLSFCLPLILKCFRALDQSKQQTKRHPQSSVFSLVYQIHLIRATFVKLNLFQQLFVYFKRIQIKEHLHPASCLLTKTNIYTNSSILVFKNHAVLVKDRSRDFLARIFDVLRVVEDANSRYVQNKSPDYGSQK